MKETLQRSRVSRNLSFQMKTNWFEINRNSIIRTCQKPPIIERNSRPFYRGTSQPVPFDRLAWLLKWQVKKQYDGNGYVKIHYDGNESFFEELKKVGFFAFHTTNQGYVVGEHQVVAYMHMGWRALSNKFTAPKGYIEVHHFNSIPWDNRPSNLVYLSCSDHHMISRAVATLYPGEVEEPMATPFNRQGEILKNSTQFVRDMMGETIDATAKAAQLFIRGDAAEALLNIPDKFWKEIVGFDSRTTKNIRKQVKEAVKQGRSDVAKLWMMKFDVFYEETPSPASMLTP